MSISAPSIGAAPTPTSARQIELRAESPIIRVAIQTGRRETIEEYSGSQVGEMVKVRYV
jgi:hypothetical protein